MKCRRNVKLRVLISAFLLIAFHLIFPNFFNSAPSRISSIFSNFLLNKSVGRGGNTTKWILKFWDFVSDEYRIMEVSKQRIDILLLVRKLVIFSVREVNQRLAGTPCTPWWVNPLSVTEFSENVLPDGSREYDLTFEVHPGAIPFESIVRLRRDAPNATHPYPSSDLFFLGARRLDDSEVESCPGVPLTSNQIPICLCTDEVTDAENVTLLARQAWNKSDPELPSWRPNRSMSVPDYIRFSTMNFYLKSPATNKRGGFCGPEVKMLVFISSAPKHFSRRASIRNTFGNFSFLESNGARLLFLFGAVSDEKLQKEINQEFLENNDIVQANFVDSYHNMTLSHLSMYNWVVTQCKSQRTAMPRWVLKADDDFFLNVPLALRVVDLNPEAELIGALFCLTKAVRSVIYMTKYYVPRYMYAPDHYAGYVSGVTYIIRTDVLEPMLKASLTTPIIHMDDAYVMGLLTREVGIRPTDFDLINFGDADHPCDIVNTTSSCITSNMTLEDMWTDFHRMSQNDCKLDDEELMVDGLLEDEIKYCMFDQ